MQMIIIRTFLLKAYENQLKFVTIFSLIAADQEAAIVSRMRKLESLTAINNVRCVQFTPKKSSDSYYITIRNGAGCSSYVSGIHHFSFILTDVILFF
jgi:hypothetical protein